MHDYMAHVIAAIQASHLTTHAHIYVPTYTGHNPRHLLFLQSLLAAAVDSLILRSGEMSREDLPPRFDLGPSSACVQTSSHQGLGVRG